MSAQGSAVGRWPQGSLMANLPEADREVLTRLGRGRRFTSGEALMTEGGTDTTAMLITEGCVKVIGAAEDGGAVLLALRVRGELVGELSALDGQPRSATVLALCPTVAKVMAGTAFRTLLRERPVVAEVVQRSIAAKLRGATRHRIDSSSGTATVRLARALDTLARSYARVVPEGLRIDVPLSHADLAALAGVSEASVQRALRSLRAAGAVATKYRGVVVREPTLLRAIAGQSDWPTAADSSFSAPSAVGRHSARAPRPPRPKKRALEPTVGREGTAERRSGGDGRQAPSRAGAGHPPGEAVG